MVNDPKETDRQANAHYSSHNYLENGQNTYAPGGDYPDISSIRNNALDMAIGAQKHRCHKRTSLFNYS